MHKNGCFFNNLIYFLPSHPKSPNLLNLKGIVQKRWINPDLLSKNLKLCIETTSEAFGCVSVSIHTLPLTGQRLLAVSLFLSIRCPERGRGFWVYLCFYPYVAPSGAEAFGCVSVSIHTLPLTGQYVFWGDSYPYITPDGAEAFGWDSYPYITPDGAEAFGGIPIHTLPLTGQRLLGGIPTHTLP
jgi:hypothetical protein